MGITDLFSSLKTCGLAALVAGGMACGDSGKSISPEPAQGCASNDDCHGGRVCELGRCQGELAVPDVTPDLTFCCGRIIYSPDGSSLSSLDVSLLESLPIEMNPDAKPEYFADMRVNSNFQKIVVSTHYSRFPFYVFDISGGSFLPFEYISLGLQHYTGMGFAVPRAQLLSDGATLIAVLGEDYDEENRRIIFRSQLYHIRAGEIPQPLTSPAEGIQFVQSHLVFPDDTIYFFGHTPEGERHLFRTDARGGRIDTIPSASELPLGVDSMYRLTSGHILVKSTFHENNLYLVDPATGDWQNLNLRATPVDYSDNGALVSPTKNQFIYQRGNLSVLHDLTSGQELELSKERFPFCKNNSCLSFQRGVWLP